MKAGIPPFFWNLSDNIYIIIHKGKKMHSLRWNEVPPEEQMLHKNPTPPALHAGGVEEWIYIWIPPVTEYLTGGYAPLIKKCMLRSTLPEAMHL